MRELQVSDEDAMPGTSLNVVLCKEPQKLCQRTVTGDAGCLGHEASSQVAPAPASLWILNFVPGTVSHGRRESPDGYVSCPLLQLLQDPCYEELLMLPCGQAGKK